MHKNQRHGTKHHTSQQKNKPLFETDDYVFLPLRPEDAEETGRVFGAVFSRSEPLSKHLGLSEKDYIESIWSSSFYQSLPLGSPTVIAKSKQTNTIVGVRLAGDLYEQFPHSLLGHFEHRAIKLIDKYPKWAAPLISLAYSNVLPLTAMAAYDREAIEQWMKFYCPAHLSPRTKPNQVLMMLGVAVKEEHRGKGLGQKMTELTHRLAVEKGFQLSVVKCSGEHPKRVFESLGYTLKFETAYDSWHFANRHPLRGVTKVGSNEREWSGGFYSYNLSRSIISDETQNKTKRTHDDLQEKMEWQAGFGRSEFNAYEPGKLMLGWGDPKNVAQQQATPLSCRAMALRQIETGARFIYLCGELCFVSESLREEVVTKLKEQHNLKDHEIMLAATHNHSAPGGYMNHIWYDLRCGGPSQAVFDAWVQSFVEAANTAIQAMQPAILKEFSGPTKLQTITYNRAWRAYNRNPGVNKVDATTAHMATRADMTILYAETPSHQPIGLISWFGLHSTCFHGDSQKIRYDHKGLASRLLEQEMGDGFVAIFAQEAAGDVTSNKHFSKARKRSIGPGNSDEESCQLVARFQVDATQQLLARATHQGNVIKGPLHSTLKEFDFGNIEILPKFAQGSTGLRTHAPSLGTGMALGTDEGPGPLYPLRRVHRWMARGFRLKHRLQRYLTRNDSTKKTSRIVLMDFPEDLDARLLGFLPIRHSLFPYWLDPELKRVRNALLQEQPIGTAFLPRKLPVQVARIGSLLLAGIAGEPTTVAGARIRSSLLQSMGVQGITQVVVGSYTNSYSGYIVTEHEYTEQNYEAGSTLYGQWTLQAWQSAFQHLMKENNWMTSISTLESSTQKERNSRETKTDKRAFQEKMKRENMGNVEQPSHNGTKTQVSRVWNDRPRQSKKQSVSHSTGWAQSPNLVYTIECPNERDSCSKHEESQAY